MRMSGWSSDVCSSDLQGQQAIHPPAARQRRLEGVSGRRQRLHDQVVQLDLAEGAACLLVRQDVLQAAHLARQRRDELGRASCRKSVSVRVDLGGRRNNLNKINRYNQAIYNVNT